MHLLNSVFCQYPSAEIPGFEVFSHPSWELKQYFEDFKRLLFIIILIYLLAPFILQNLKKILPPNPELWGCAIFGPKMTYFPKWEFFRKPVNELCVFHSCLSTGQILKSDINLLVKYWWLKNTEISLVESRFCL